MVLECQAAVWAGSEKCWAAPTGAALITSTVWGALDMVAASPARACSWKNPMMRTNSSATISTQATMMPPRRRRRAVSGA